MTLQRTQLIGITSITGINTVGIFTAGVTPIPVGIASTSYIRSVIMHNTGTGTCRCSLYVNPNHTPVQTGFADDHWQGLIKNLDSLQRGRSYRSNW